YPALGKKACSDEKKTRIDDEDDEKKLQTKRVDIPFVDKQMASIKRELVEIMNCTELECMETNHKRHHEFLCDPISYYEKQRLNFGFGESYFTANVVQHLQMTLSDHIFCSKLMPGTIFTRYYTFTVLENNILEKLLRENPICGMYYLTHVLMKEAIVFGVCLRTGLPMEEAEKRCKETETSMKKAKRKD
ncbi:uncharacterized protein LOC134255131, partial [Saccostrea cucullata]|uniref:uncharacterized protein LOC134255131 n=1 Tax=Saccostrea cuccullata TaxID=36930 RepID=UPI002ED2972E